MINVKRLLRPAALILVFLIYLSLSSYAEITEPTVPDPVVDEYVNSFSISSEFEISNGTAYMSAYFLTIQPSLSTVDVEMLIEYQLSPQLYLPIKSYSDSVSGSATSVQHELQLSFTGTYRLTVTVTVSGPFGPDDAYQNTHTDYN